MELTFSLSLPDEMHAELVQAAVECRCTTRDFAGQVLEAALASRRLPRVFVPVLSQGAQMRGTRGARHEDEENPPEPEGYPVHWPEGISSAQE